MTGAAVNLAAVRAVRDRLDAIVAAHPELTRPASRDRLAAALPEIATMTRRLDPNDTGASTTVGVRLPPHLLAAVEAERDRLAALVPGSSIGLSDAVRALILRALAAPSTSAPAASPAPAAPASRAAPVEAPAAPSHDPRQLGLAGVVALHRTADGHGSVATPTGNDNATSPAKPAPSLTRSVDAATLASLKTRLAAAVAAGRTVKSVAAVAGVNDSGLIQWRKGATGLGPTVAGKLDVALTSLGF